MEISYLGAYMGQHEESEEWVWTHVDPWYRGVIVLNKFYSKHPQMD